MPGPRLQISVILICQTGGHGDAYLGGAGLEGTLTPVYPGRPPHLVDGPEEMRQVVRAALRAGADWIKLATTGGLVSDHDQPLIAELTPEEIAVAVFEAGRKGKGVAAHAYGGDGLTNAVKAGVRSIEHGGFLTEEQAALMAESGCFLVPTLSAMRDTLRWAEEGALTPTQCKKILDFNLDIGACVRLAKEYGVRLASGTDYISREQHGKNLEEILLMHRAGLTVEEALLTATAGGAELCGVDAELGRIARGLRVRRDRLDRDPGDLSCFAEPGTGDGRLPGRPADRAASAARLDDGERRMSAAVAAPFAELRRQSRSASAGSRRSSTSISRSLRGSIHALVGENGAGKSTLGKILAGVHRPDAGELRVEGRPVEYRSARDALTDGITIIAQEPTLVPASIGASRTSSSASRTGTQAWSTGARSCSGIRALVDRTGIELPPRRLARTLRVADQQKVEILRAIARDAKLIVMDEPTSALTLDEARRLFDLVRQLQAAGTTIIYVTHFLAEALDLADTVTVLRDGRLIRDVSRGGRDAGAARPGDARSHAWDSRFRRRRRRRRTLRSCCRCATSTRLPYVNDVSFEVRAGEIVGLAGLIGSGRSEVARAIFGADRASSGSGRGRRRPAPRALAAPGDRSRRRDAAGRSEGAGAADVALARRQRHAATPRRRCRRLA